MVGEKMDGAVSKLARVFFSVRMRTLEDIISRKPLAVYVFQYCRSRLRRSRLQPECEKLRAAINRAAQPGTCISTAFASSVLLTIAPKGSHCAIADKQPKQRTATDDNDPERKNSAFGSFSPFSLGLLGRCFVVLVARVHVALQRRGHPSYLPLPRLLN
jgi:hypothetical protein